MYKLILLLLILPFTAQAQYYDDTFNKPRTFSVEAQYVSYSDIVENNKYPQGTLGSTYGLNLNARFNRIFSLVGMYGTTAQKEWSYYGLGIKVDLPGFFFIGGYTNDLVRKKKKHPVNTSLIYSKMSARDTGSSHSFIDDRLGFAADIFLAGNVYLNVDLGLLSHQGNQFFAPGFGLGYEF